MIHIKCHVSLEVCSFSLECRRSPPHSSQESDRLSLLHIEVNKREEGRGGRGKGGRGEGKGGVGEEGGKGRGEKSTCVSGRIQAIFTECEALSQSDDSALLKLEIN